MLRRPLLPILFLFVGGILAGHFIQPHLQIPKGYLTLLIVFLLIFLPFAFPNLKTVLLSVAFFLTGTFQYIHNLPVSDLMPSALGNEWITLEGTVLEAPKISQDLARFTVRADKLILGEKIKGISEKIRVTVYRHPTSFMPGDRIRFPARLRLFKNFRNPGRYDYELAMKIRGLTCSASVSDGRRIVPMGRGNLGFPLGLVEGLREPIRELFQKNLSDQNAALYRALILGERQGIHHNLREPFSIAGVGHVLAVSGLHIGLVAWLAFFVVKSALSLSYKLILKTNPRTLAAIITCIPVVAYTCLAGFQVSSQRAMIMVLTYLFSLILGREKEIWSTLALAALLVLAWDPLALFSLSFQLSFCAVVGILWLAPVVYDKVSLPVIEKLRTDGAANRLWVYFAGLFAITVSATFFLLPLTTLFFHRISFVAIPANLMAIPLLGLWVIPAGLLSATVLPLSSSLAGLFLMVGDWGLTLMMGVIQFWGQRAWAATWVVTPNVFEIILFYLLLLTVFFLKRWRWAKAGLAFVLILVIVDVGYWVHRTRLDSRLVVTYLDVGQGSATLIEFPGKERMLIDGGGFRRGNFDVGRMVLAPFLLREKIRHVDYLVLTHPQSDHMNGLRFIASHFHPKEFWHNGDRIETPAFTELMDIINTKRIRQCAPSDLMKGREISGVKIELLHPLSEGNRGAYSGQPKKTNDRSLVIKLSYRGKSFLFPGDIEKEGERMVVSNAGQKLRSDVLLAPHHGSRSSCTTPFLNMIRPDLCVISSGRGNYMGLPHNETLRNLDNMGVRILRIDRLGAVRLIIGKDDLTVKTFVGGEL